jgi:flavin reductase (DIM6/NTAB) family NADH-FMN oxidoreductase RutF
MMKKSLGAKTILYPTPVFIVGTYDSEGKPNVMTAAWGGISCSVPPCVAVSLRKATYTYDCVVKQEAFTISLPSEDYVKEADYFGMVSGRDVDKFAVTGLTPAKSSLIHAPYVEEFPLVIECKLIHTFELGLHTQFIGEILDVKVDESVLGEDKLPALDKLKPILFAPENRAYHGIGGHLGKAFHVGREIQG